MKQLTNGYGARTAIRLASSKTDYPQSFSLLRNFSNLVCVRLSTDDLRMIPFMMIVCGIKVIDSLVGTSKALAELMDMAARMEIKLIIKIYDLARLDEVL